MLDVKDRARAGERPAGCIQEGERMFYTHPDERVERGSCEPARPVQAICCEDDMPGSGPSSRRITPASPARLLA
jgi:NAD-dependent dihydropyrimidine dehydrogenase PreA subunit